MVTGAGFELFESSMDWPRNLEKFQLNFPDPVIPINNERSPTGNGLSVCHVTMTKGYFSLNDFYGWAACNEPNSKE